MKERRRPQPIAPCVRLAAALLLSAGAFVWPTEAAAQLTKSGAWYFPSMPALAPPGMHLSVDKEGATGKQSGHGTAVGAYIFVSPIKNYGLAEPFVGRPGPEILEPNGNPVWQDPLGQYVKVEGHYHQVVAMDFHPAVYNHQPVLVWWQGYITPSGFGNGVWEIANNRYQVVAQIKAPPHFELDFHDIALTPQGDAYIIANRVVPISLTCCGGPPNGSLYDQVVFEVNVKSGRVIWGWDTLQHVRLRESYAGIPHGQPWDPYHLNAISFGPAGAPIISARNTWAAYWIDRRTGQVFAQLGGKHSTFRLGPGARFAWQHDVNQQAGEKISVFDDEAAPPVGKQSRGLILQLNWKAHTATVVKEYLLPHPALAGSQGSVEWEPNGNVFVGWGQLPYLSEYTANGELLYLGALPGPDESYRTYRGSWSSLPLYPPSVVATASGSAVSVGASWNGATGVAAWQLLAGATPSLLSPVGSPVTRSGFETILSTTEPGPYYAVEALGSNGQILATSPTVTADGKPA